MILTEAIHTVIYILSGYLLLVTAGRCIRQVLLNRYTILPELDLLRSAKPNGKKLSGTVVIAGGRSVTLADIRSMT
jgi:hypothetical protein